MAEDIAILLLPIPYVWRLRISLRQRLAVIALFSVGSFACMTSAVRVRYLVEYSTTFDETWDHVDIVVWSFIEQSTAMLYEGEQKMTYADLIYMAFRSRKTKQMGLGELYHWFKQNTSRANTGSEGWKNSVRSNLSLNKAFQRVERKGSFWQLTEAGLTEFQPTRKLRTSRRRKAETSTEWKISVAPPPPACAPTLRDASQEIVCGSDRGDDGPWSLAGSEESQPESGPSTDYPTPMSIVPMQDGLEYMHDPLWAWNLDSRRYIHWPYCSCLCGRHQLYWTSVDDICAPPSFPPTFVNAVVGSSPPSETSVPWEI
ncbi:integral membrane protein [Colletotrichum salicis]|uniref:Integral membrane protein n=1 Tax=Colletotrichum salicis TaxID=1209931 RepID=A0A135VAI2_9PEZI|nr:integral membrane protein [Colletotrichum salicis]